MADRRAWKTAWCATHGMQLGENDRCWSSVPLEGECERIMVWVVETEWERGE